MAADPATTGAPLGPGGPDDVAFRPIRSGNLFDQTVRRLVEAITLGVVAPGDRLPPERELVERLGVSRATLREAIRVLARAGYVAPRQGRNGGTFVLARASVSSDELATQLARRMGPDLLDALTFRSVLEPAAAALAAEHAAGIDLGPLRAHLARMADLDRDEYRAADFRFHVAIAEFSGSPSLAAAVGKVQVRLSDVLAAVPLGDDTFRHANVRQHAAILDAIEAGRSKRARRLMGDHLESTATFLRSLLG